MKGLLSNSEEWSPIYKMDSETVQRYTTSLTRSASITLQLTKKECAVYQQALIDAINYFHARDENHKEYMNYLQELKAKEEEERPVTAENQKGNKYYRVIERWDSPTFSNLHIGFDEEDRHRTSRQKLCKHFGGRVGEQIDERNGFIRLRFADTPDGKYDDIWVPRALLRLTIRPPHLSSDNNTKDTEWDCIFTGE